MSEDRTPVEVAARILHDRIYAGFARPEWGHRSADHQQIFLEDASAAFGSVDLDGLAAEIGRHWLLEPSHAYGGAQPVERSCNCGRTLAPQYFEWRHSQEMTQHEAEAVKAWLTKEGA